VSPIDSKEVFELRIREAPAERRVVDRPISARKSSVRLRHRERRPAHRLDSSRDQHLALSDAHRPAGGDDGLEAGSTETIHGRSGHLLGHSGQERRHARDVPVVLPGLVRAAEDDVLDLERVDACALDCGADGERRQIVRAQLREAAAVAPDRRPHGRDDHRLGHERSLFGA
jgi:hypothetical protein